MMNEALQSVWRNLVTHATRDKAQKPHPRVAKAGPAH
ncbi:hypothetical protein RTM1035_17282 [Roseovarius sp. TM1035]|nr:hypothetical protein RTM1035_17282 [Roseovarius sp. TM1035]